MDRRAFLRLAGLGAAGLAVRGSITRAVTAAPAGPGPGPYPAPAVPGPGGLVLPDGFTGRVVAEGGRPVRRGDGTWHRFPDGGATFPLLGGGWAYVSNSEVPSDGGAGALRFDAQGQLAGSYRILTGTSLNCAGGPTPWGTWLSCEEHRDGRVWECVPGRPGQGVPRPMLGTFAHEAVAVDPVRRQLYLTEDDGAAGGDGFYRFTPDRYPSLAAGRLEVASVAADGDVSWLRVDPLVPMEEQRPAEATPFDGAEGVWYDAGHVYFTTKTDDRIWDLDVAAQRLGVLYDAAAHGDAAPLRGVDSLTMSAAGDLFVAEDGGNMELVVVTKEGDVAPFLRIEGHEGSEVTGPAFDPSGRRLYFSSQRGEGGNGAGLTYEVTGPFRGAGGAPLQGEQPPIPLAGPAGQLPLAGGAPARMAGLAALATATAVWAGAAAVRQGGVRPAAR